MQNGKSCGKPDPRSTHVAPLAILLDVLPYGNILMINSQHQALAQFCQIPCGDCNPWLCSAMLALDTKSNGIPQMSTVFCSSCNKSLPLRDPRLIDAAVDKLWVAGLHSGPIYLNAASSSNPTSVCQSLSSLTHCSCK